MILKNKKNVDKLQENKLSFGNLDNFQGELNQRERMNHIIGTDWPELAY